MDEDIFKDMIDYGDDSDSTQEVVVDEPVIEDNNIEEDDYFNDDFVDEEVTEEVGYYEEYTEDMDEPEYEDEFVEEDIDDERLVAPMIKPILKYLIPLFVVLALMIFVMTSDIAAIKSYRENFMTNVSQILYNMGIEPGSEEAPEEAPLAEPEEATVEYKEVSGEVEQITQYRTEVQSDMMITFDGASNAKFAAYGEGILCAKTNYLCYINKDGEVEWEKNISITNPILKTEGDYFVLAQKGGVRFDLYRGSEGIYEQNSDNNILSANVSANGDVVLITEKTGYKGAISVYNKRGDKAFAWSSGSSSIISADISAKSRRVAAALLNTDDIVKSGVYLFNIRKPDSYAQQIFEDSIIYNVDFKDDNLNVFADNRMTGMKKSGNISYQIDFGATELASSAVDDNGDKLLLFTGTNVPVMNIYNSRGKLKNTVTTRRVPDFAYVNDGNVIYNVDREIFLSKLNTRIPYKYTAAMDIQGLIPIDSKSFAVIYSNSISVVEMKGVVW